MNQEESTELTFPQGLFHGKELNFRITADQKWVSAFDIIQYAGGQKYPQKVWERLMETYKNEITTICRYSKFGKKGTPVVNAKGLVKLLMWIPGDLAKQFRSTAANILVRYLGGDTTLCQEIETINELHIASPNNNGSIFRNDETVQKNLLFTQDQLNNSKNLLTYFGEKTNIFYMFLIYSNGKFYIKFGIVHLRDFKVRFMEHCKEFNTENICCVFAIQCKEVTKLESEFKKTLFYMLNKKEIQKSNGSGFHTEIFELDSDITSNKIKTEIMKVVGDRIIDPPPTYSYNPTQICNLDIEKEKTLQEKERTKQIEESEKTKRLQIEFEMKKMEQFEESEKNKRLQIEFEMKKMEQNNSSRIGIDIIEPALVVENNVHFQWFVEHVRYRENSLLNLTDLCVAKEGKKLSSRPASVVKNEMENFIKTTFPDIKHEYTDSSLKKIRYKGWLHLYIV